MIACSLAASVAMRFRVIDRVTDWSHAFKTFNLNGLMALFVLVPVAATVYSYRRYQDAMSVRGELARLSLHDSLTGLPNRLYLNEWLTNDLRSARRDQHHVAVLFIDLDRFKFVNDTYGHEVGDELMVAVAKRLRDTLRPGDRIVRYGGDEFVVICPQVGGSQGASKMANRLVEALESPFHVGSDTMRISTSIGVAITEARDEVNPDDLVREADVAMYQAKAEGRGNFVVFDRNIHGAKLTPLSAEERLRVALEQGEFRLYYQPVVDIADSTIVGAEALIRWEHPERGLVPPNDFVPVLEDTGLIVPVGTWVLEEACRQAKRWHDAFPDRPPMKVTVNVSARQLAQVDFKDRVAAALRDSGVRHESICLEITEGALMFDVASAWAALRHAKTLGVKLALDDFGTGYSSLSYIRRFSLDLLKVDKSFVDGLGVSVEDTAIVEHVIGMARAIGMVTVAEGIEQAPQVAELQRLGCDLAQGWYFGKAMPADELTAALQAEAEGTKLGGNASSPRAIGAAGHVVEPDQAPPSFHEPDGEDAAEAALPTGLPPALSPSDPTEPVPAGTLVVPDDLDPGLPSPETVGATSPARSLFGPSGNGSSRRGDGRRAGVPLPKTREVKRSTDG